MVATVQESKQTELTSIWQPVLVVTNKRLECACGAKAIFVMLDDQADGSSDWSYDAFCQDCWERETEE